ncbi:Diadenylate cyclase [Planctomycetales bacterium 10988]|nr:Diadenylate cyclase [Planctomycetales bacterium 10988]
MKYQNTTDKFQTILQSAERLATSVSADAMIVLAERPINWERLETQVSEHRLIVGVESKEEFANASAMTNSAPVKIDVVLLSLPNKPVFERLTQFLLECVAEEILPPGSRVIALYSGFEADTIDSFSIINLGEHLERLTARDLKNLETKVPLESLKVVVDLATEIGSEGREGKPVGTLFVIGDHRKVLQHSRPAGFDCVKGYNRKERNLFDRRVREPVKEIAQLDGAFVVSAAGIVESCCRYIDAPTTGISLAKGLGSRHWAAAAISKVTKAISVSVSESSGSVRIFQNGEMVLRIEPFRRRPMKWKEFEYEPPATSE